MSALSEKMCALREHWVPVGKRRYLLRVPTKLEACLAGNPVEAALRAVVGWEGVRQCDLLPGEPDTPAAFDAEAFREFVADDLGAIKALMDAVTDLTAQRVARIGEAEKN